MCSRGLVLGALLVGLSAVMPPRAHGAEWRAIVPGTSTTATVQAQFGDPSRISPGKLEGYDTAQWVYEGSQAPTGMNRMTVDFGLLAATGYRPDVVRTFRLEPKPGIFTRETILMGWGVPSRAGDQDDAPVFYYEDGLVVIFDAEGWLAQSMLFTVRQPHRAEREPRRDE